MDLEDEGVRFKKQMLESYKEFFEDDRVWNTLKKYNKDEYEGLDHLYSKLRGPQKLFYYDFADTPKAINKLKERFNQYQLIEERMQAAKTMEPTDSIDLTNEIAAKEIRYHPPRPFDINSNNLKKRFDIQKFNAGGKSRHHQSPTSQTRLNNYAVDRQPIQKPHAEKFFNQRDPRMNAIPLNQKYYGATSRSSYQSTQQNISNLNPPNNLKYNVLPSTSRANVLPQNFISTPPPQFNMSHQPPRLNMANKIPSPPRFNIAHQANKIPSPPRFNIAHQANKIPSPPRFNIAHQANKIPNQNVQRPSFQQFQRNKPSNPGNFSQTPLTYKEHKQKKHEEREAKRRKFSRWDNRERVLLEVPLCNDAGKRPNQPRKESVEVILSPKPTVDISSSSQSSVHKNVQPISNGSTSSTENLSNNQSISSERPSSTETVSRGFSNKNNLPKSVVQSSILVEHQQNAQDIAAPNLADLAWKIKEECESDTEEEGINDGASVCSSSSSNNINLPENAPCEDFIPLNIKEEPIDPPNNVNSLVNNEQNEEVVEDKKPEIKIEPKVEDDADDLSTEPEDEEIDEKLLKGDSDPGSDTSDDEEEKDNIDLLIQEIENDIDFLAEFGGDKPKNNLKDNSLPVGIQRVKDWLQRENLYESPPLSPCYDQPMPVDQNDNLWEMPDEVEDDDDSISIINYEPKFNKKYW